MPRERACPICRAGVKPAQENEAFPFCSPRCKTIDLGSWLDEKYRVATDESGPTPDTEEDG